MIKLKSQQANLQCAAEQKIAPPKVKIVRIDSLGGDTISTRDRLGTHRSDWPAAWRREKNSTSLRVVPMGGKWRWTRSSAIAETARVTLRCQQVLRIGSSAHCNTMCQYAKPADNQ